MTVQKSCGISTHHKLEHNKPDIIIIEKDK